MASALTSSSSTSNGVSDRIDIFCSLDNTEIGILDDADNICTKLRIHFNLNVKVVQIVPGSRLYTDKDVREAMDKSKLVLIFGTKYYGGNENENVTSFGTKEQLEIIALRKLPYYIIKMCNNFKYTRVRELFDGLGPFTQWNCRGSARSEWNRSDPLPEDMIGNIAQAYMSASRYRLEKTNPHAIVKKIYTNGIYEGQIEHEQRNGRGSFLFNTTPGELRQRYEGEWLYDMITGHGVQTYIDGSRYEGDFESNLRSGHGVCVDSDGNNYNGCYKRDQKCGYGRFSWKNGSLYEGYWRNDVRHGSGTFSWPSGDMYTGSWRNDKKNGLGVYRAINGSFYEGNFVDDMFHGTGILRTPNGSKYEGEWRNDKKHGRGVYLWSDGSYYTGDWVLDRRFGYGIWVDAEGFSHEGEWRDDQMWRKDEK